MNPLPDVVIFVVVFLKKFFLGSTETVNYVGLGEVWIVNSLKNAIKILWIYFSLYTRALSLVTTSKITSAKFLSNSM